MKIRSVAITVQNVAKAVRFYRDTLLLPVEESPAGAVVTVGWRRLVWGAGQMFDGAHHLAFGIPPPVFGLAREWLSRCVPSFTTSPTPSRHWAATTAC